MINEVYEFCFAYCTGHPYSHSGICHAGRTISANTKLENTEIQTEVRLSRKNTVFRVLATSV